MAADGVAMIAEARTKVVELRNAGSKKGLAWQF
jgi:hypothetical protein